MARRILSVILKFLVALLAILIVVPLGFVVYSHFHETDARDVSAPHTGRFVHTDDVDLFITEAGSPNAPTIFILHGMAAWSETWRPSIDSLSQNGWHVIAIDMPPFGYSERPADLSYWRKDQARRLYALTKALDLKQVTVLAHSFGSRAGVEFALEHQELVRGLVLVDPALDAIYDDVPSQTSASPLTFVLERKPLRTLFVASTMTNPLLAKKLLQLFMNKKDAATDEVLAVYQRPSTLANNTRDLGYWLYGFMTGKDTGQSQDRARVASLRIPVGIIWGREDTTTPLSQGTLLHSYIPQSTLTIIDGVGHMPHIENTPVFLDVLRKTLSRF